MWWLIGYIALIAIGIMVGVVVLWLAWQIIRLVLNIICSIIFGTGEIF